MPASQDDILTALKSHTQAINNSTQTLLAINGIYTAPNIDAATLIKPTSGRMVKISIITPGSGDGSIYDISSVAAAGTTNKIGVIESAGALIQEIGLPFLRGLVVTPGTGMVVAVSYS